MIVNRTPRRPGLTASGYPRCGRPAGPVAKLAGQNAAVVGQRDRTSPGEPSSLGGPEGKANRREWSARQEQYKADPRSSISHQADRNSEPIGHRLLRCVCYCACIGCASPS